MSETKYLKLFKHDNPPTNKNKFDVQKALNDNWDKSDEFAGKAGAKLNLSIDPSNYIMTLQLLNINDEVVDEKTIDFPLESVVVSGRYDKGTKKVVLILQNGTEVEFPIGDLIDGLVSQSTFDTEIQKINVEITSIKGRLDTIEAEQTTQNTEIEKLREENKRLREDLNNSTITASNSGENITIKDSTDARFKKLKIGGNTYQETSEFNGQYCPPVNEWELKNGAYISEDGYVMLPNENSVASIKMNWNNAAENFFVGADFKFTEEIDDNSKIYAYFDYLDNGNQELGSNGSSEKANVFSDNRYKKQIGNVQNKIKEAIYIIMRFQREKTYAPKEYGIKNVSVRTSSNYDYEEFIPNKPSPDHPSPIRNCGDNVNLFDGKFMASTVQEKQDYTNEDLSRNLDYESIANKKFITLGGYFKSGTYTLSIHSTDHWYSFNRIAIAGTNCRGSEEHIRNSYTWTQNVDGYTYFSIERDTDKTNYTDALFDAYDFMLKIEKGAKATQYSPYGYGNMNFVIEKNLLDWKKFINESNWKNAASQGYKSFKIERLKPSTSYTLCRVDNEGFSQSIYVCFNNNNTNENRFIDNVDEGKNLQFTTATSTDQGVLYITYASSSSAVKIQKAFDIIKSCWIVEGTGYMPHEEQSFSFPTKPGQVFHKRDFLADDGTHHKRKTIELDGTENLIVLTDQTGHTETILARLNLSNILYVNNQITYASNAFKAIKPQDWKNDEEMIFANSNRINFSILRSRLESEDNEGVKAFFAKRKEEGKPVIVEYELEEEEIEPYSPEQQEERDKIKNTAKTYKGITHIFSEDEVSPEFEEEHLVDLEAYINSKLNVQASEPQQEVPSEMPSEEPSIEQPQLEETEVIGGEE